MYTKIVQSYDPVTKCKFKCGKEEKNFSLQNKTAVTRGKHDNDD